MMASSSAISVKNLVKSYGSKIILDGLSMNVERGTIYGLLGASGCGKTTLLSCIVGRKTMDAGEILVLGGRPGEKGSGVPGPKVGYMPQETALVEEFTIKDTIYYFGTIYKMKPEDIKEQFECLTKLLELPDGNKLLKHCSGGQQRRVSFAAALVHSPELLILDEPTVGVDPILREKIWDHLRDLVRKKHISVIITTHYIEETKEANSVGLMREGKLLIENSPQNLLSTFQKDTLEEVFLILSRKQEKQKTDHESNGVGEGNHILTNLNNSSTSASIESFVPGYGSEDELTKPTKEGRGKKNQTVYMSAIEIDKDRVKALMNKNWKQFYRNNFGLFFLLTFPFVQMWFFNNSIGNDPRDLNLGIVNDESMTTLCDADDFNWNETTTYKDYECHFRNLTCRFLTYLEHPMINKVLYNSLPDAINGVKHGDIIGVLYIPTNFSESFQERIMLGSDAQEWIIDYGEIKCYMDMSSRLTGATLVFKLLNLFIDFQKQLFSDCHMPEKFGGIPLQKSFIYGDEDKPMTVFIAPGLILMLVYLLGSTMTSQIIVKEKIDGVWDRSIVAGVSSLEITLSHLSLQCVIMLAICTEVMIMINFVPGMEIAGNICLIFMFVYLQGVCGMAYGFFVSTICINSTAANLLCTGGFLPMTIISGVVWPLEAMPHFLRWISMASPCTLAILSFRNVMAKGWGLFHLGVFDGVLVVFGWILVFGIASVIFIKIKR